ncbi:MAG: MarC family protein [Alphaproteobacteria bacterium]
MIIPEYIIHAFATMFVVVDPIGLLPIFLGITAGSTGAQRRKIAFVAVAVAFAVLLIFAVFGHSVLGVLGVGMPAFRIAGGIMLFLIAVEMLFEKRTERRNRSATQANPETGDNPPADQSGDGLDVAVFPIAIPLIAGPGAIASLILLMSQHKGEPLAQGAVVGVMIAVLAIALVTFLLAHRLERFVGARFTLVLTRVLGIILGAIAVQFVLSGLEQALIVPGQ